MIIEQAIKIATQAHEGQFYIAGSEKIPYFQGHLEPVAEMVRAMGYGQKTIATAYLHDVIEDTNTTAEMLLEKNLPEDIVIAIQALTKQPGEPLEKYIARVCLVPRAIPVKFADSTLNLATTLNTKDQSKAVDFESRKLKYEYNLKILKPLLPSIEALKD